MKSNPVMEEASLRLGATLYGREKISTTSRKGINQKGTPTLQKKLAIAVNNDNVFSLKVSLSDALILAFKMLQPYLDHLLWRSHIKATREWCSHIKATRETTLSINQGRYNSHPNK